MSTPIPAVNINPRKVAIVGFASNTRDLAPFKDDTWEIWGLNNLWSHLPRFDRWFEMHDPAQLEHLYGAEYVTFLKGTTKPVYMQKHYDEYPSSVEFPRAELTTRVQDGRDFWPSSIQYMLALAIDLAPQEIGLYGVDLLGPDEYSFQREGCALLIGTAIGRGIKVTIPPDASLLKSTYAYGYEDGEYSPGPFETFCRNQIATYAKKKDEALATVHTYDGAAQAYQNALTMFLHNVRGGALAKGEAVKT